MSAALLVIAVLALAFANGANDNFKGVATLHGSGRLAYRPALIWATVTTLAGSFAAILLGSHLVATFSGKGIVPQELVGQMAFVLPVAAGASMTVLLATRIGMPISTTHALLGGLLGAGLALVGSAVSLAELAVVALLPLLLSPLAAAVLTFVIYRLLRGLRLLLRIEKESCVCLDLSSGDSRMALQSSGFASKPPVLAHRSGCPARNRGSLVGLDAQAALDGMHYLSTGAVCFARGLNDTPKIVALLTAAAVLGMDSAVLWVALVMALGGLLAARRVAKTVSHEITSMNDGQGFSANLVTALLVLLASPMGMPVSTTHVSCGALFGIGAATGGGHRRAILAILGAWLLTLPLAAGITYLVAISMA